MPTFDVLVASVSKAYHDISLTRSLAFEPDIITVNFPPSVGGISAGAEIQIKRNNMLLSKGKIQRRKPILTENQKIVQVEGNNNFYKLADRLVGVGEDVGEPRILISNALVGTGIALNPGLNYGSNVRIRKDRDKVSDYIRRNLSMTNGEARVKPDDTLDLTFGQLGTDKSASINFEVGKHVNTLGPDEDITPILNRLYAFGKGDSEGNRIVLPAPGYVEDVASQTIYGLREGTLRANDVSTQADLQTLANKVLAKTKDKVTIITIDIVDPKATGDYDIGDKITLTDPLYGTTGTYRVQRQTIFYSPETSERVTLELSNSPARIDDIIEAFQAQLDFALTNPQLFDKPTGVSNVDNITGVANVGNTTGVGNINNNALIATLPQGTFQIYTDSGDLSNVSTHSITQISGTNPTGSPAGEKWGVWIWWKAIYNAGQVDKKIRVVIDETVDSIVISTHHYENLAAAGSVMHGTAIWPQDPNTSKTYRITVYDYSTGSALSVNTLRMKVGLFQIIHIHTINDPGHPHTHSETAHPHSHSEAAHPHSHSDPTHTH